MSKKIPLSPDVRFGFLDSSVAAPQIYNPKLVANRDGDTMLSAIQEQLITAHEFVFSVAFITSDGLAALKQALVDFNGQGTIITSRYLDFNEPDMFRELLNLHGVKVLVHDIPSAGFHAKGYLFTNRAGVTAIIGSSNLTVNALKVNEEWNLKFSTSDGGDIASQLKEAVDHQRRKATVLTHEWINSYEENRQRRVITFQDDQPLEETPGGTEILPNPMQSAALEELDKVYVEDAKRAVIISATGTGKTILAALAAREAGAQRVLFVVHREQILRKAAAEFQKVFLAPKSDVGFFVGDQRDTETRFVFATVQSLAKESSLWNFHKAAFDYIIIDEVHHAGADSYHKIIDYFDPQFLLGLTATPERTDGFNIFELFDWNVPFEIRLQAALKAKMLAPFHYYGISDYSDRGGLVIDDETGLKLRTSPERVDYITQTLAVYGFPRNVKGLMFCSRKDEAHLLSTALNEREVNGKRLRTIALTGDDSNQEREKQVSRLSAGELDYILTVDIFNEGVDVPAINQIVMLRSTQSSILFTQQLGRGLRKFKDKNHLRVIDFIGNYDNNYLIPIALNGDNSANKDSIRRRIIDPAEESELPPTSTVNFDRISQQRILDSLSKAQLVGKRVFRQEIQTLVNRLNHVPALMDFARFNTIDPVIIASKYRNYWSLLTDLGFVETAPSEQEAAYLSFMAGEILNGMRPHELLLIRALIREGSVTRDEFVEILESYGAKTDEATIKSAERVLTFEFFKRPPKKYGTRPLLVVDGNTYRLDPAFSGLYETYTPREGAFDGMSFRAHTDDLITTGLFLNRERHSLKGELLIRHQYTRKDVSRLLNWPRNGEATIFGYKLDQETSTVPIFVTYHKSGDTESQVKYADHFKSPSTMRWFSRHGRTLDSDELEPILENSVSLLLFVKKDDSEGTDFYYLGPVRSSSAEEDSISNKEGKELPIVSMNLDLESPVELALYRYLNRSPNNALPTSK